MLQWKMNVKKPGKRFSRKFFLSKPLQRKVSYLLILEAVVQRCSVRKGVLRNFTKLTGKHLCQCLFFFPCFPLNFVKFLRTPFLQNTSGGCFYWSYFFSSFLTFTKNHFTKKVWNYDVIFKVDYVWLRRIRMKIRVINGLPCVLNIADVIKNM